MQYRRDGGEEGQFSKRFHKKLTGQSTGAAGATVQLNLPVLAPQVMVMILG
jgi:hypothetical protein